MKIEILNITQPLSAEVAQRARESLKGMTGVRDVAFFDSPASVHATLEDIAPTRAELMTVLASAGVQVAEERRAHGAGSCCGGCGS
ncbi:MAG TPA: hypothetical protein PKC12_00460 [Thiobacillaceae bacterium]|nr:hypothetical protein [Thiobacillaceae bacterium]